jgi:hypothetical protein
MVIMTTETWTYTFNLDDIYYSDALSLRDKANIIANRIERSRFFQAEWTFTIADVVDEFRDFGRYGDSVELFDGIMRHLYDYADTYRVWVKTR